MMQCAQRMQRRFKLWTNQVENRVQCLDWHGCDLYIVTTTSARVVWQAGLCFPNAEFLAIVVSGSGHVLWHYADQSSKCASMNTSCISRFPRLLLKNMFLDYWHTL
jgi:hypothetical protein